MSADLLLAKPAVIRGLGLFGSICCAIDGYLLGASRQMRLNVSVATIATGPNGPLILALWFIGLTSLCVAWWHGRRLAVSTRWTIVTAALWIVPMLVIPPLASRDVYAYACQGALYHSGANPYTQSVADQPCPWLTSVSPVWRTTSTPYGPIFIVLSGMASAFGSLTGAIAAFRLLAVLGLAITAAFLPLLARRLDVPAPRAVWLLLCSPLVPVHIVGGAHNDALTIGLMIAGLALIAGADRGYGALVAGGALLGAACAVKISVGAVLPFAALLVAGAYAVPGFWRRLLTRGATVVAAALVTLVGLSYATGLGLGWIGAMSDAGASRSATSPPTSVGYFLHSVVRFFGPRPDLVPWTRNAALGVFVIVFLAIAWHSRRRNPLFGGALALVALIFLAPIAQPWYLVWPLALVSVVLVRARWLMIAIMASMYTVLPDGDGSLKPLTTPLAYVMTALTVVAAVYLVKWLRGAEPAPDDAAPAEREKAPEPTPVTA